MEKYVSCDEKKKRQNQETNLETCLYWSNLRKKMRNHHDRLQSERGKERRTLEDQQYILENLEASVLSKSRDKLVEDREIKLT